MTTDLDRVQVGSVSREALIDVLDHYYACGYARNPCLQRLRATASVVEAVGDSSVVLNTRNRRPNRGFAFALSKESSWDTDHFGFKVAKVQAFARTDSNDADLTSRLVSDIMQVAKESEWRLIVWRAPAWDYELVSSLHNHGGIPADILLTFHRRIAEFSFPNRVRSIQTNEVVSTRLAERGEAEIVASLAQDSFTLSHFHSDPIIARETAGSLFGKWARNCVMGLTDAVIVAEDDGAIVGFITCRLAKHDRIYGVIDLIAVAKSKQRKGIGRRLVAAAIDWFEPRTTDVLVGTQAANLPACRQYEANGFALNFAEVTFHLWN